MVKMPPTPICPHCKEIAPHGDARHTWNSMHLDSRPHRWWWALKKVVKRRK